MARPEREMIRGRRVGMGGICVTPLKRLRCACVSKQKNPRFTEGFWFRATRASPEEIP